MKTYKVKLRFNNQEIYDFWVSQMSLVRDCYNFASKIMFDEKLPLNIKSVHNRLYKEEREKFQSLPSQICIQINRQVLSNYRTVRSNRHKPDKPITMKNPSLQLDKRLYSKLNGTSFKLNNGKGNHRDIVSFVTYPKFSELFGKYQVCDPKIKYDERNGVFYGCFSFIDPQPNPMDDSVLGVDLGLKRIATTSDGVALTDKKYLANRRRIRHKKRVLQMHKKHSHSARTKLKKLRRKEANVSRNFCHHLVNEILKTDKTFIVMEDLTAIKQSTSVTYEGHKKTRHNNMMSQVPFYQLKQILTYKAQALGKRVVTVSPKYTSQEDCRTNERTGVRKGCRYYCNDGIVFDADWNAAINICNRYKHSNSFDLPIDGKLNLNDRVLQQPNGESRK